MKEKRKRKKAISLPFISDKEKFTRIYREIEESSDLSDKQLEYLEGRYKKRQLWAKAYLKSSYGGGISTTPRVESFHAKLKNTSHHPQTSKKCSGFLDNLKKFKSDVI